MRDRTIEELAQRYLDRGANSLRLDELRVLKGLQDQRTTSRNAAALADEQASFGEKLADRVAAVGGSWAFIIAFGVILVSWMFINTDILSYWGMAFDPYPYIFLNLMLSTLAAIQAPLIMMSQNRQSAKDRLAARLDYEVNLRAELEILLIHEKLDATVISVLKSIAGDQKAILDTIVAKR